MIDRAENSVLCDIFKEFETSRAELSISWFRCEKPVAVPTGMAVRAESREIFVYLPA